jgi:hypothetical protein
MIEENIVEFWREQCSTITSKYHEAEDWTPWLGKTFVDGTLMDDSNPEYDLINSARKRAIRIIKEDPQTNHIYAVWLNKFGEGLAEPDEVIEEMVFTYRSCQESFQVFLELFDAWANPETSYSEMQSMIASRANQQK